MKYVAAAGLAFVLMGTFLALPSKPQRAHAQKEKASAMVTKAPVPVPVPAPLQPHPGLKTANDAQAVPSFLEMQKEMENYEDDSLKDLISRVDGTLKTKHSIERANEGSLSAADLQQLEQLIGSKAAASALLLRRQLEKIEGEI